MFRDTPFSPVQSLRPETSVAAICANDAPQPAMTLWLPEGKTAGQRLSKLRRRAGAPRKFA